MENNHLKESQDTGLVLVLILLVISYFFQTTIMIVPAICTILIVILWPDFFRPLARIWFGFSNLVGRFGSAIVLTIIFILVVTPIGVIRRTLASRPYYSFKNDKKVKTVFKTREHLFEPDDLEKPY